MARSRLCLLAAAAASAVALGSLPQAFADVYMHNPRGSNNRYINSGDNDDPDEVDNDNRLFDSQNNNDGGYETAIGSTQTLKFYAGSILNVEWASQHACGRDSTNDCEYVLQYMCGDHVREGTTEDTVPFNKDLPGKSDDSTGMHEPWYNYHACYVRYRNKGLFIADQNVGDNAIHTRQDAGGERRGLECNEERDYYPYWMPSPWIDIAVLTSSHSADRCELYYRGSQNTNPKFLCVDKNTAALPVPTGLLKTTSPAEPFEPRTVVADIDEGLCKNGKGNGGVVVANEWSRVAPHIRDGATPAKPNDPFWGAHDSSLRADCQLFKQQATAGTITQARADELCALSVGNPLCLEMETTRDNHLGFVRGTGDLQKFVWTIPDRPHAKCVLRLRYNITTADYAGWNTTYTSNGKTQSPVLNDPYVRFNWDRSLQLAVDTSQFGRTFQDRSHVFAIGARPENVTATQKIHNLNVRGKRGTVAEAYPSPTFSFTPRLLTIAVGDWVHFQWEGADTENANRAGGGTQSVERHNLVQIRDMKDPFPLPFEEVTMFTSNETKEFFAMAGQAKAACGKLSSIYTAVNRTVNSNDYYSALLNATRALDNCAWLNKAPSVFYYEPIQFSTAGTFYFTSTRDNRVNVIPMKGMIKVA